MSHRSYQPTLPCGSKVLQQKWDATYYREHRRMVKSAKPTVDTSAPAKPPHVIAKWKKQQLEKERAEKIERDNLRLMTKMTKIMTASTSRDSQRRHSLNDEKRRREAEKVALENKAMLERLEKVKPVYRISDWIDDWQRSEELTKRITAFPVKPPSRSKSAAGSGRRGKPAPPPEPVLLQPQENDTGERSEGGGGKKEGRGGGGGGGEKDSDQETTKELTVD